jgi:hypothetical protein
MSGYIFFGSCLERASLEEPLAKARLVLAFAGCGKFFKQTPRGNIRWIDESEICAGIPVLSELRFQSDSPMPHRREASHSLSRCHLIAFRQQARNDFKRRTKSVDLHAKSDSHVTGRLETIARDREYPLCRQALTKFPAVPAIAKPGK